MFAERVLVGPKALGHGFADDHGRISASHVIIGEVAAAQERDKHRVQIAGTDAAYVHFGLVSHGHDWLTFDGDGLMGAAAAHGKVINYAGGLNAWSGANLLKDAIEKGGIRSRSWEFVGANRIGHGEKAIWSEARDNVAELPRGANNEGCVNQKN